MSKKFLPTYRLVKYMEKPGDSYKYRYAAQVLVETRRGWFKTPTTKWETLDWDYSEELARKKILNHKASMAPVDEEKYGIENGEILETVI